MEDIAQVVSPSYTPKLTRYVYVYVPSLSLQDDIMDQGTLLRWHSPRSSNLEASLFQRHELISRHED